MKNDEPLTKAEEKSLQKSRREAREGRTYLMACATHSKRSRKCKKSGLPTWVCFECHVKDCRKWYKLGQNDERKRADFESLRKFKANNLRILEELQKRKEKNSIPKRKQEDLKTHCGVCGQDVTVRPICGRHLRVWNPHPERKAPVVRTPKAEYGGAEEETRV